MSWQDSFASYTTSAAFSLTLSSKMIAMLHLISEHGGRNTPEGMVELHGATIRGLEARGLVTLTTKPYSTFGVNPRPRIGTHVTLAWDITPAGEHVIELLRLAGLIVTPEEICRAP